MSSKVGYKTMENNKSQDKVNNIPSFSFFDFIGDVKAEFQKISWTSKDELKTYTKVVVAGTFIFGLLVYGMDLLIQISLSGLNGLLSFITG